MLLISFPVGGILYSYLYFIQTKGHDKLVPVI